MVKSLLALAAAAALVLGGGCDKPTQPVVAAAVPAAEHAAEHAAEQQAAVTKQTAILDQLRTQFVKRASEEGHVELTNDFNATVEKLLLSNDDEALYVLKKRALDVNWDEGVSILEEIIRTGTAYYTTSNNLQQAAFTELVAILDQLRTQFINRALEEKHAELTEHFKEKVLRFLHSNDGEPLNALKKRASDVNWAEGVTILEKIIDTGTAYCKASKNVQQ